MGRVFMTILLLVVCSLSAQESALVDTTAVSKPEITMLELGSTTCVPCKMMEPVMESLRESYGEQIEIIFYDVKEEKEKATQLKVRMIPTQIFLDADGNEIHRHTGFYAEELIDNFLQEQGLVKVSQGSDQ